MRICERQLIGEPAREEFPRDPGARRAVMFVKLLPALVELTERERTAFVDHHYRGLSKREIAVEEAVSEQAIGQLLSRADRRLDGLRDARAAREPEAVAA